jgi:AcrR family transcriptional regulator
MHYNECEWRLICEQAFRNEGGLIMAGYAAPSPVVPRRVRIRQEREDRILDAAADVFAQRGFHRATIREIAEPADLADGTIYNYFGSKADLLIGIMSKLADVEDLPGELEQALQGNPKDFFMLAFQHRLWGVQRGQQMLRAILPEVLVNPELREHFYQGYVLRVANLLEAYVQAQIARKQVKPVNAALTVRAVLGLFVGLLFMRSLGDEPLLAAWDQVPKELADLLFEGLNPD